MTPYYRSDTAQLWHGDCLAVLPLLPAGSVDLVLADLPYGTTACAWDSVIPLDKLWTEYRRILKPRGAVVLTASQPFTSALVMSNPTWFKYDWIWRKSLPTGPLNSKKMPMRAHEEILVFAAETPVYNPQLRARPVRGGTRRVQAGCYRPSVKDVPRALPLEQGYPLSVVEFNTAYHEREAGLHPTQKPVALGRYLIRTYSNPGDLVLDNTMGVGSFGVAAIEEGRRFIGIERAPDTTTPDDYCGIARDRILAAEAAAGRAVPLDAARQPLQLGMAWEVA